MRVKVRNFCYSLGAFIFLMAVWWGASLLVKQDFLPTPRQSWDGFLMLFQTENLTANFLISLERLLISFGIALALAVPLGIMMGRIKWLDQLLMPLVKILYPLPKIVFLPIFIVFLGLGNAPKILIITLIIFFQILVIVRDATKNIPNEYLFAFQTLSHSHLQLLRHVIFPAILPDIITSLRISVGSAIAVLFFAETFAAQNGLGYVILDTMEARNYAQMYGGIIAMSILGFIIYEFLTIIEHYFVVDY